jgi:spore coat protein U-like protein
MRRFRDRPTPRLALATTLSLAACAADDVGTHTSDTDESGDTTRGATTSSTVPTTGISGDETADASSEDSTETGDDTTGDPACVDPAIDCAPPSGVCMTAVCGRDGECDEEPVASGTPIEAQTEGDCKVVVCDGAGGTQESDDDDDTPEDDGPCFEGTCTGGEPGQAARTGETCGLRDDMVCNDLGECVGCLAAADCGDDECLEYTCTAEQTCTFDPVAAGATCAGGLCDGAGDCDADTECYVDENCTEGLCSPANICVACLGNDDCGDDLCIEAVCVPFGVTSIVPADGQADVDPLEELTVAFNADLLASSVTTNAVLDDACTGTFRLSSDGFARCLPIGSALADADTVTLTPAPALSYGTAYEVLVADVESSGGSTLAVPFESSFTTGLSGGAIGGYVVISQVYGGGGNSGAPYTHDFVELHNRGDAAVDLDGWSIQYAASGGNFGGNVTTLSGTIAPGAYHLVQLAGGAVGDPLPTPDVVGTTNLAATAGKVALVRSTDALPAEVCPSSPLLVDFVGYGNAANCAEGSLDGSTSTGNASNTAAALRNADGCTDTDDNAADFTIGAPAPRNAASTALVCFDDAVRNEGGAPEEVDACRVFLSGSEPHVTAEGTPFAVFGNITEAGLTNSTSPSPIIVAEVGFGPWNANPQTQPDQWLWETATFVVCGSCETTESQYTTSLTAGTAGAYMVAARFSLDGGLSWTYCDGDGSGSDPGLHFDVLALPRIQVDPV